MALIVTPPIAALPPIAQTPTLLAVAHAARTLAPVISAALAVALAVCLWRKRTWRETALLAVALACVALSRANVLECMFPSARAASDPSGG